MNEKMSDVLEQGIDRMHKVTDYVEDLFKRNEVARQAKNGLLQTRDRILASERSITRHLQKRPLLFILLGVGLLGMIIAKQVCDRSEESDW